MLDQTCGGRLGVIALPLEGECPPRGPACRVQRELRPLIRPARVVKQHQSAVAAGAVEQPEPRPLTEETDAIIATGAGATPTSPLMASRRDGYG